MKGSEVTVDDVVVARYSMRYLKKKRTNMTENLPLTVQAGCICGGYTNTDHWVKDAFSGTSLNEGKLD